MPTRAVYTPSGALFRKKWGGAYYVNPAPPDCFHSTRTVVIIDILLRTRAAMHTTIAAAAVCQFEDNLSEANCFLGPLFCGGPCSAEHAEHA